MKIIRLKVHGYDDRQRMITALANSGYHVWVEERLREDCYYVCFEMEDA